MSFTNLTSLHLWPTHYQNLHLFTLAYTSGTTCLPWFTPVAHYQHHHLFTLAYTCGPLSASPPFALAYICDPCFYPSLHLQPTSSITTCFP